jgi:uncharacterized membrane protein (UPF0182 family)
MCCSTSPGETHNRYIRNNIEATRAAYGVDKVEITDYSAKTTATAGQLRADAEALPGIRLIDPNVVSPTFEQLQQVRGYYAFPKILDVDRYTISGRETDAVVAVREMDLSGVEDHWNNRKTVYTHGYGLVAAYGNRRQPGGEPEWIAKDIPPTGLIEEHEPCIYFGELQGQRPDQYSIVGAPSGTPPIELDAPGGGEGGNPKTYTYAGKGGVNIGSIWNRLLYAAKFADVNILHRSGGELELMLKLRYGVTFARRRITHPRVGGLTRAIPLRTRYWLAAVGSSGCAGPSMSILPWSSRNGG